MSSASYWISSTTDKEVGALVITGGESVFSAGMDLKELLNLKHEDTYQFWNSSYNVVFEKIYNFRVPTIAAVSGYALAGGFDLSISCDFRIASETTVFGQAVSLEINKSIVGSLLAR